MSMPIRRVLLSLLALVTGAVLVPLTTATPSYAAGCYNTGCDDVGPKAAGCWDDYQVVASGGEGSTQLRYSPSCRAYWAFTRNGPRYWSTWVHLEMEEFVGHGTSGSWVFRRRLIQQVAAGSDAEWTNALGSRNGTFRFRALWVDTFNGGLIATPWASGR